MAPDTNILLAYYGDDFTGSTDVMEALARAGMRTVLFLKPPAQLELEKFPGLQAFGIAGGSRTMPPHEMERLLPPAFEALKASGAPIVHYKICSTFDSAPAIGSIGKAIEIGRRVLGEAPIPLVVGAPVLGRYVVFGNLFARSGLDSDPTRLDRHPTMSRHPVTPMTEADLRVHLAGQTNLPVELVDVLGLESLRRGPPAAPGNLSTIESCRRLLTPKAGEAADAPIVLFDTLNDDHLRTIGGVIDDWAKRHRPLFCVGSSGLEYALMAHRNQGASGRQLVHRAAPVRQFIAVSGSCSPVTARQMDRAERSGFILIQLNPTACLDAAEAGKEVAQTVSRACAVLAEGRSIVIHTSHGPDDPRIGSLNTALKNGGSTVSSAEFIGTVLGKLVVAIIAKSGRHRLVVCGGDTSTFVARSLGIEAIEFLAPMAPGSPLCKVHATGRAMDGSEIVFKGGQVGRDDFFLDVLAGGPPEKPQTIDAP